MEKFLGKIVLATDGTEDAALATQAAVDLSFKTDASLHVIHTWSLMPAPHPELQDDLRDEARRLLGAQVERISRAGGKVARAYLRSGPAADAIVDLAGELEPELVVMGSRGLGIIKSLALGSVSETVVHRARCPVLVLRGGEEVWPPGRVVAGDDGSEASRAAGELAAGIARLFGAEMLVVRVYSPQISTRLASVRVSKELLKQGDESLEYRVGKLEKLLGDRPGIRVFAGDAAACLQEMVGESVEATLTAVGSRGLGAVRNFTLGSVSKATLRTVGGCVLVTPPPGVASSREAELGSETPVRSIGG